MTHDVRRITSPIHARSPQSQRPGDAAPPWCAEAQDPEALRARLAPRIPGDVRAFLSAATGFGTVGVKEGEPFVEVRQGEIPYERIAYTPYDVTTPPAPPATP